MNILDNWNIGLLSYAINGNIWLKICEFYPKRAVAKRIARMLQVSAHSVVVELIDYKLKSATAEFGNRTFNREEEQHIEELKKKAEKKKEPFVYAKDGIESEIHLMIWEGNARNERVEVETFEYFFMRLSLLDFQL